MIEDRAQAHFARLFGPEFGHGRSFDLQPLRGALAALGNPQDKLAPIVHVAGTNGKGSTIAFLRAIAEAAGQQVHAFTKPHLLQLRERFGFSDAAVIRAGERVKATGADISQFEAQVAAAFLLFAEIPADLVLIETGLGGRDDATNVIARPALSVLTPIDLDHQAVLGQTRAEIAAHKAGIIKPGAPAVSARADDEVCAVLEAQAAQMRTRLFMGGRDWDGFARGGRLIVQTAERLLDLPAPRLCGPHQFDNAALAAVAALQLGYDDAAIARGIASASWPGRLEALTRGALAARVTQRGGELWVDGGHNPHAASALARALKEMRPRPNVAIAALRARKDAAGYVAALARAIDRLIAIPLEGDAGASPGELCAYAEEAGVPAQTARTLEEAIAQALAIPAPRIVICGSLLLAGEALQRNSA